MMYGRAFVNGCRRSLFSRRILNSISPSSSSVLCRRTHDSSNAPKTQRNPSASSPFISRLQRILQNEIQYQYDYAPPHQPPTEIDKFTVQDRPGELWITLTGKSAEDENIKIEATMFDGSVLEPNSGDDESEDTVRLHISMLVDVWKEGETNKMEFVCSAWPESLEIQKIYVFRRDNPAKPYMGPDITNLGQKLQTEFYKFLHARGVNDDLCKFLHQYMSNKDRIEYMQWLGKVQSYFEK
ncbi:hypothetical protein ACS0TY_008890 [Phlomoides rotata]